MSTLQKHGGDYVYIVKKKWGIMSTNTKNEGGIVLHSVHFVRCVPSTFS